MTFNEPLLIKKCNYHQVLPLVYYYREELQKQFPVLSEDFFRQARTYSVFNATRVMVYENFLAELDKKLSERQIEYRILKGLVMASELYPASYLRAFGDLDIIVKPESITRLNDVLTDLGFQLSEDLYSVFPESIIRKYSFARHYIRSTATNIAVDVHLNLSGKLHAFQFDIEDFWKNSRSVKIGGRSYPTFSNEYLTVYLLYHAFKHHYFKLMWLIDFFKVMDTPTLDVGEFERLIVEYKMEKLWRIFIRICDEIFGQLPVSAASPFLVKYSPIDSRHINAGSVLRGVQPYSPSKARIILPMVYLSGFGRKTRFLFRQLFPPREVIRDFYCRKDLALNWRNYFKLRKKTILEMMNL
ncbi:MAG: nucleotidyltransferase family protein [Candidatus Marinimicrobia bacterium]|nr:nucleotidyltransferase family protein [Candidatus Neomarinimicrobiota bacterium]